MGVDTGGTFTDLVLFDGEGAQARVAKLSSTPDDPARAVLEGLAGLTDARDDLHFVHGTTVALNALLSGRGLARTAWVTNAGFRDLIEIGRQDRPELYALHPERPAALVERELRFEIDQRTWPDPETGEPRSVCAPSAGAQRKLLADLRHARPASLAIGLLHAYADPQIELDLARALEPLGVPITCSATLLREYREFERFSTAIANAALVPLMRDYLGNLEQRAGVGRLSLMQSNGGTLPAARAAEEPVRVLFSGPAGGVIGAARAAAEAGFERMVGLDMGGTSTDVAFARCAAGLGAAVAPAAGRKRARAEDFAPSHSAGAASEPVRVGGHPIGVPALDIHTIGCGGGSLARVDSGGVLHVGPESAGADPGPVCYGRGEELTVTDAHVLLGHVAEGEFLAGQLRLDRDRVQRRFELLGQRLGTTPLRAARGVLDLARAAMRRAVGVMTMQRGQDPAELVLVGFGGAGGLHAAAVAHSLRMRAALVPELPGLLSAVGMANADAMREVSRTLLTPLASAPTAQRRRLARELVAAARADLRAEGHAASAIDVVVELDLRYAGQAYELRLADSGARMAADFHRRHAELYGHALEDREIELVALRTRATVARPAPRHRRVRRRSVPADAIVGERRADFDRAHSCPVIRRERLAPGHGFAGPALVEEYSGTTLVPPGWSALVTAGRHLRLAPS